MIRRSPQKTLKEEEYFIIKSLKSIAQRGADVSFPPVVEDSSGLRLLRDVFRDKIFLEQGKMGIWDVSVTWSISVKKACFFNPLLDEIKKKNG